MRSGWQVILQWQVTFLRSHLEYSGAKAKLAFNDACLTSIHQQTPTHTQKHTHMHHPHEHKLENGKERGDIRLAECYLPLSLYCFCSFSMLQWSLSWNFLNYININKCSFCYFSGHSGFFFLSLSFFFSAFPIISSTLLPIALSIQMKVGMNYMYPCLHFGLRGTAAGMHGGTGWQKDSSPEIHLNFSSLWNGITEALHD